MHRYPLYLTIIGFAFFLAACGPHHGGGFHKGPMPDPKSYNAHFGDMDADGDGRMTPAEFRAHFPDGDPKVFPALDRNSDGAVDHDEWHEFKEAHGLRHKE